MKTQHRNIVPTIGITLGDPAGIGPEIIIKALSGDEWRDRARFVLIGDRWAYEYYGGRLPRGCEFLDLQGEAPRNFQPGQMSAGCGRAAYTYLMTSIRMIKQHTIDGLVTAPVSKQAIMESGQDFPGHTEILAREFSIRRFEMMFVGGPFKTIVVTRHIPLAQVAEAVTLDDLLESIRLADRTLRDVFKIARPRIALCGINPHAGEGGRMGKEEGTRMVPAIEQARADGIDAAGPFGADTLFIPSNACHYDLIMAMYHDQGLAPIKAMYFTELVNFTIGLPFVRTSTAHGTAFDIAGKNKADPASMRAAIELAVDLTRKQQAAQPASVENI